MQLLTPKILRCKKNLFCFLSKKFNLHTMKCQIRNAFQHLEQVKFSLIQQISSLNTMYLTLQMRTFASQKGQNWVQIWPEQRYTSQGMWHIWGHLKTVTTIIKLGTMPPPSPHPWRKSLFTSSQSFISVDIKAKKRFKK